MVNFKNVLILGGTGLVGKAICHKLIAEGVSNLTLVFLGTEEENWEFEQLQKKYPKVKINREIGNIFFPAQLKDKFFTDIELDETQLNILKTHFFAPFSEQIVKNSYFYQLISKYQPEVIIDCVNAASQLAYCRLFENHDSLIYLTRFFQILYQTIKMHPSTIRHFVKIGTTGTGGMGFNIPYTHGEEQPSQPLLLKSAVGGAYSQLLMLLSRTPGTPVITEIKPAAAIAWGKINFGPVKKGPKVLNLDNNILEVNLDQFTPAMLEDNKNLQSGQTAEAPYLDSGENGFFSLEEFRAITADGQMEFVRPEEIASLVWLELNGKTTGRNIVSALESSVLPPSYGAGLFREDAIDQLEKLAEQHQTPSVAFELLGPPKLTKLLFEAFLILNTLKDKDLTRSNPKDISQWAESYLRENRRILLTIVSTGLPLLIGNNQTLIRGSAVKIKALNKNDLEKAATEGWVDIREKNIRIWQDRIKSFLEIYSADKLKPGNLAAFIFTKENSGCRII